MVVDTIVDSRINRGPEEIHIKEVIELSHSCPRSSKYSIRFLADPFFHGSVTGAGTYKSDGVINTNILNGYKIIRGNVPVGYCNIGIHSSLSGSVHVLHAHCSGSEKIGRHAVSTGIIHFGG